MPACVERGCVSELVVYPREGHGFQERQASPRFLAARGRLVRSLSEGGLMQRSALLRFILQRLAIAIPLLVIVSFGVFALVHLAPGDPARALLGSRPSDPATLAAIREKYHLNDPFLLQYWKWLWQVLQGDLGTSIQGGQLVTFAITQRVGVTLFVAAVSAVIVMTVGFALACWRGSIAARASTGRW